MAFRAAIGYGNLPNGVFSPVIYSKKVQKAFRQGSVIQDITNTEYFGEISSMGDSVKIIKEPEVFVQDYLRGGQVRAQDIIDEDFTLIIDQAKAFAFKIDDIEAAHSHVNWMEMVTNRAGYRMKDQFDKEVLGYLTGYKQSAIHGLANTARTSADVPGTLAVSTALAANELLAVNVLKKSDFGNITTASAADHSIPIKARLPGATAVDTATVSPFDIVARMGTRLDVQNVDTDGRWLVVDPYFLELMREERSVMFDHDSSAFTNGLVVKKLHGFRVYVSNNLPRVGTGPSTTGAANQNANYGVIVAGHDSAIATAEQINKTERLRDQDSFADVVRGLHLYGRKIIRPEGIVTAKYNVA